MYLSHWNHGLARNRCDAANAAAGCHTCLENLVDRLDTGQVLPLIVGVD